MVEQPLKLSGGNVRLHDFAGAVPVDGNDASTFTNFLQLLSGNLSRDRLSFLA